MESRRPVIGLDVDGVVAVAQPAATDVTEHEISAWGRWKRSILVPVSAAETVACLARNFEVVWVSGWGHNAHTSLLETLDLPREPWRFLPVQFGQARAVSEYAGERPWALVHDGVDADEAPGNGAGFVVRVDPHRGIADLDCEGLVRRLEDLRQRRTSQPSGAPR